jgi:pimeloyl-ACP methyl ester carboxylesterase
MRNTLAAKLVLPALFAVALASDGQQPATALAIPAASAEPTSARRGTAHNTTIVLVHGAWADGTGWQDVIPILQRQDYKVIAVQNPLTALNTDVETTKRVIDGETKKGRRVVVVGHSYGGAVMSGAAAGNSGVKALVYIAAFAPDAGEPIAAFLEKYPTELPTAFEPDAAGFLYLSAARYRPIFAADLPERQTRVMQAAQKPAHGSLFGQSIAAAAWRTIPSWYVVAQEDKALSPGLQRFYATRMKAGTTEIKGSHVVFISRANQVAKVILDAAATAE